MSLPGFEPGAFRLGGEPSIQLRYRDIYVLSLIFGFVVLTWNAFHNEVTDCIATGTVLNLLHQKLLRKLRFPVLLLIRAITSAPKVSG